MTPYSSQRLIVTMVPTLFKRSYQIIFLSAVIASTAAFFNGWVPTISAIESLSQRSPILCLFHWLTQWDCPGCGFTRSIIAFFSGSVPLSFYFHPLGPLLGVFFCYMFIKSFHKNFDWNFEKWIPKKRTISVLLIVVAWGVLRNF